jgi:hypothetical protein
MAGGEGGDFFSSRRSAPLRLSIPQARNFVLCLSMIASSMAKQLELELWQY